MASFQRVSFLMCEVFLGEHTSVITLNYLFYGSKYWLFDHFLLCLKTCMFCLFSATPPFLLLKIGRFFKLGLCDRYQVLAICAELATYLGVLISPPPLNLLLKLKI